MYQKRNIYHHIRPSYIAPNFTNQGFVSKTDDKEIKIFLKILYYTELRKDRHLSGKEMLFNSTNFNRIRVESADIGDPDI